MAQGLAWFVLSKEGRVTHISARRRRKAKTMEKLLHALAALRAAETRLRTDASAPSVHARNRALIYAQAVALTLSKAED